MKPDFILDLKNAILPYWYLPEFPRELPVVISTHDLNLDCIMENIDPSFINFLMARQKTLNPDVEPYLPLGIDLLKLPTGAILRRV